MAYFVDFISFDFHPDSKRSMLCTFREPEIQSDFFLNRDLGLMICLDYIGLIILYCQANCSIMNS